MHGHIIRVVVGLLAAAIDLILVCHMDLDFLLQRRDGELGFDLLLAHAALQRDGEFADAVHIQETGFLSNRDRTLETGSSGHRPFEDARAVAQSGVVAVRIELDYVTVVDGVRAGAALRQAVDIELDAGIRALLGVLAVLIGDGVVLRERVDRLD